MGNEVYLKGRTAGVDKESYGMKRKGLVEKTAIAQGGSDLASAAGSIYKDAVNNRGDKMGDKALTER